MELDITSGPMELNTKVNGETTKLKDKVVIFGKMAGNMKENGLIMK